MAVLRLNYARISYPDGLYVVIQKILRRESIPLARGYRHEHSVVRDLATERSAFQSRRLRNIARSVTCRYSNRRRLCESIDFHSIRLVRLHGFSLSLSVHVFEGDIDRDGSVVLILPGNVCAFYIRFCLCRRSNVFIGASHVLRSAGYALSRPGPAIGSEWGNEELVRVSIGESRNKHAGTASPHFRIVAVFADFHLDCVPVCVDISHD